MSILFRASPFAQVAYRNFFGMLLVRRNWKGFTAMTSMELIDKIIPFYGADNPRLFAIERRCMDRAGKVIDYLNNLLPNGMILDIGAGNGFTAQKLTHLQRRIVALEPAGGMIDRQVSLPWTQGVAQELPFKANSFSGAYATWAYFFPTYNEYGTYGLKEIHRVVMPDHPLVIVDNAGGDEFCSLFERDLSSDSS
jgi:ubiquinone/menaquinone biosynthesis C-methylase UbiE